MGRPYIVNVDTLTLVNPAEIFGKDANRIITACEKTFLNWLYNGRYEGCYVSPSRPSMEDIRKNMKEGDNIIVAYKAAMVVWASANPEEFEKEERSRKEWDENRDRQFRIIYGIARRHGVYLKWHGNDSFPCYGDQWTIYKNKERIARIYCM